MIVTKNILLLYKPGTKILQKILWHRSNIGYTGLKLASARFIIIKTDKH